MRIALIAPPFIPVPPKAYGGTELFVAHLAEGLKRRGHTPIVYANGESTIDADVRWLYRDCQWPPARMHDGTLRGLHHAAWAIADAEDSLVDVVHINDALAVPMTRFLKTPSVMTLHHPHEPALSALYAAHPDVSYVCISEHQRRQERLPKLTTVHHGLRIEDYAFSDRKDGYLCFLGRFAPMKWAHIAIDVARRTGLPLKLAGEIQPAFADYWERDIEPLIDGRQIEYIGEANLRMKNELLSRASALLFPITWDEPFGLVMIEAMACGTPVLAFGGGSVPEIVQPGVSGWICSDAADMARRALSIDIEPAACREHVRRRFALDRMVERYCRIYEGLATLADVDSRGAFASAAPLTPAES
jgi:glycosyltransferase involved in cell wall biosynthesis